VDTISPSSRKQIVEGKDINLAMLLIPNLSGIRESAEQRNDPRLNKSLNISEFIQAFAIYKSVMCFVHPQRREELDLYERDIIDMASRYSGKGFYEYHRTFSAQATV